MKRAFFLFVVSLPLSCTTTFSPATIPRGIPTNVWADCHKQADIGLRLVRDVVLQEQFDEIAKPPIKACARMALIIQCVAWRQAAEKKSVGSLSDLWCTADAEPFLKRELSEACGDLSRMEAVLAEELADTAIEQILFAAERFGASVH